MGNLVIHALAIIVGLLILGAFGLLCYVLGRVVTGGGPPEDAPAIMFIGLILAGLLAIALFISYSIGLLVVS